MRVSTGEIYTQQVNNIQDENVRLKKTTSELSSGLRVEQPADDPFAARRVLNYTGLENDLLQYQRNIDWTRSWLVQQEEVLDSSSQVLRDAYQLAIQANTDSLNQDLRANIAPSVVQSKEQMYALANEKTASGEYLFAGTNSKRMPFVLSGNSGDIRASVQYVGNAQERYVEIGPAREMRMNDAGSDVYRVPGTPLDVFATLDQFIIALEDPRVSNEQAHQILNTVIRDLQLEMDHISAVQSDVGARREALDQEENFNSRFVLNSQINKSNAQDADIVEVASRQSQELLALQAAYKGFARIQNLSLFDALK